MRTVADIGRILGCCLLLLATSTWLRPAAAGETGFVSRTYSDADGVHRYAVYIPAAYSSESRWPVVLYLHGAGFSGHDGQRHLTGGLASIIRAEGDYPAIVVFPQCEDGFSLLTRWLACA
jgi:poly(3-hydroxybutyrate) depolymerase